MKIPKNHLCPLAGHWALRFAIVHGLLAAQPSVPWARWSSSQLRPQPQSLLHRAPDTNPVTIPALSLVTLGWFTHPRVCSFQAAATSKAGSGESWTRSRQGSKEALTSHQPPLSQVLPCRDAQSIISSSVFSICRARLLLPQRWLLSDAVKAAAPGTLASHPPLKWGQEQPAWEQASHWGKKEEMG